MSTRKRIATAAFVVAAAGLFVSSTAGAHGGVGVSVAIGIPGVVVAAPVYPAPPVYYNVAPVYVAPPVVYAPPPRAYYAPPPVHYGPPRVVYGPRHGHGYYAAPHHYRHGRHR